MKTIQFRQWGAIAGILVAGAIESSASAQVAGAEGFASSDTVRVGVLAGGLLERGGLDLSRAGLMVGTEVAFLVPGHRFALVPDVRVILFPLAGPTDWHGYWILRSGLSIRWSL